jgi:L-alanine-DL-glutamate epimerase-like enolase superfamily enzyme
MKALSITAWHERWPVRGAFVISRGPKTHVDVVLCKVSDGLHRGLGESTPIYYHGETADGCVAAITACAAQHPALDRNMLQQVMPRGAARNALDAAFWDWEVQQRGRPLWQCAGLPKPRALTTAFTVSLASPAEMEAAARIAAADYTLLKIKLAGDGDRERVGAVRRGAPDARLIVDANGAWDHENLAEEIGFMHQMGVELIEQPVHAGQDHLLSGLSSPIPLCADESCQDSGDIPGLAGLYQAVNIKLDKAGGLTEAIRMADAAEAVGLKLMVGCMLSTSLGIRPAFALAQRAEWVDLDGPALLERDRAEGYVFAGGKIGLSS